MYGAVKCKTIMEDGKMAACQGRSARRGMGMAV